MNAYNKKLIRNVLLSSYLFSGFAGTVLPVQASWFSQKIQDWKAERVAERVKKAEQSKALQKKTIQFIRWNNIKELDPGLDFSQEDLDNAALCLAQTFMKKGEYDSVYSNLQCLLEIGAKLDANKLKGYFSDGVNDEIEFRYETIDKLIKKQEILNEELLEGINQALDDGDISKLQSALENGGYRDEREVIGWAGNVENHLAACELLKAQNDIRRQFVKDNKMIRTSR